MNLLLSRPLIIFTRHFGQTRHPYELEGILRPALELQSSVLALSCAGVFFTIPQFFMLSPVYGALVGAALCLFGLRRLAQGIYCLQYKRILNEYPAFKISVATLGSYAGKTGRILLGKGFLWKNQHTQRVFDLENIAEFNQYVDQKRQEALGGKAYLHGVGALDEQNCYLELSDRIGHTLIYGQTRVGKSRLLELMIEQDIASHECVVLIDPKGDKDLVKRVLSSARRHNRMQDVMILHLGFMQSSVRYNPLASFQNISEVAGRISKQLPNSGDGQAFANFAWRFVYIVAQALRDLGKPINVAEIKRHVSDYSEIFKEYSAYVLGIGVAELERKFSKKKVDDKPIPKSLADKNDLTRAILDHFSKHPVDNDVLNSIISAFTYEKSYYDKITASLLPFLEKLSALGVQNDGSPLPTLSLEEAIDHQRIVVLCLDGLSDSEIAHAFGAMFLADLVSLSGKRYKLKEHFNPIFVHADEFNEVVGDEALPLLNKAAGAGVIVSAYTQTDSDLDLGFKSNTKDSTKALVAKGNFRTVITGRVGSSDTAKFFTSRLPQEVVCKYSVSSTELSDSSSKFKGVTSATSDKIQTRQVPLVSETQVMSLPVGQFFVSKNGGHIFKIRCPLFDDNLTQEVGSIEAQGLGNMIREVNLGTFAFADRKTNERDEKRTSNTSKEADEKNIHYDGQKEETEHAPAHQSIKEALNHDQTDGHSQAQSTASLFDDKKNQPQPSPHSPLGSIDQQKEHARQADTTASKTASKSAQAEKGWLL